VNIKHFVVGLAVGAVLMLGSVACGSNDPAFAPKMSVFTRLDPEQFAARMGDAHADVINVHVPYEGELEKTNALIPFDRIVGDPRLPKDKNSEILLYCRSGRMSEMAGEALVKEGYTNVSHLEGGMKAWEESGKPIIHKPQNGEPAAGPH
jgi:rhodanese-related sulfurtransferase